MKEVFEKIKERLQEWDKYSQDGLISVVGVVDIVNQVAEEYNQGLTENKQGWIPCSERVPEGKETYKILVTDGDGIMAVCYFLEVTNIFKVCWNGEEFQGAIAWQPLPDPYKPEGE